MSFFYANKARSEKSESRRQWCINHRYKPISVLAQECGVSYRAVEWYLASGDAYKNRKLHITVQFQHMINAGKSKAEIKKALHLSEGNYYLLYWKEVKSGCNQSTIKLQPALISNTEI